MEVHGGGATLCTRWGYNNRNGTAGSINGGKGGYGHSTSTVTSDYAGAGSGNPSGGKMENNYIKSHIGYADNGCGGLLIILSKSINNNGVISSEGQKGENLSMGGGSSGGGSINIFYKNDWDNNGNVNADGGKSTGTSYTGGAGGNGSISIGNISSGTYQSTYKNY